MKKQKQKQKTKRISIILFVLILLMSLSGVILATEPETTDVVCTDLNLYDALAEELEGKTYRNDRTTKTIRVITDNLSSIKELKLANANIVNLDGMEHFTSLESLNLSGNSITSVQSISGLTNLKILNISYNKTNITDLNTLSSLINLTDVNFASSQLSNVDFMSDYALLEALDVSGNSITSLDPIKALANLKKLNIANNTGFNRFQTNICCHTGLVDLDISNTAIQVLDEIQNLVNLETLKLRYLDVNLAPIVARYSVTGSNGTMTYLPYLENLKLLDISYTTSSISFSQLSYLTNLTHLYMIDVIGKWKNPTTTTQFYLNGIYDLQNLQYINLGSNNISNLNGIVYEIYNGQTLYQKKYLSATEIYLQDNNISDLAPLTKLEQTISVLNLSYNKISDVTLLESCNMASDVEIDLRYQDVTLNILKKSFEDQYIILPSLFQDSKREGSFIYSEDTNFVIKCNNEINEQNIRLNAEEPYLQPDFYNVIINKSNDVNNILTLEISGNSMATGSKITFKLGTAVTNINSLLFKDANLCQAIKDNLKTDKNGDGIINDDEYLYSVTYIENAHLIMNINNNAITGIPSLHLASRDIADLTGMENFTGLTNLVLSNNRLTTIEQLQYCVSMRILEVANNNIGDNNTAITKMTTLQELDLSNTNMTDIDCIETLIDIWTKNKYFYLKNLRLSGNNFTNQQLERIKEIVSLTTLILSNNNINEVESFANLKNTLSIFDISQNQIEDIATVGTFTNLVSLNLSNNKIRDISPIANCNKLSELNLSANNIEDISSLSSLAGSGNLLVLNMNNNKIKDISAVDKSQISQSLLAENQRITQVVPNEEEGIITISLPQIFMAANNVNSKFYDNGEGVRLSVVGKADGVDISEYCSLTSDKSSILVNTDKIEGNNVIVAKIQDGNADNTTLSIAPPLEGTITCNPSNENPTNQDITATITFNRANVTITNNDGNNTYKFTENGEFTFEFIDEYGFEGTETAVVENIDKEAPQATEIVKQIVNKQIVATIKSNEQIKQPEGWALASDGLSITKTYAQDANETVNLEDLAGNITTINMEIKIDTTAPIITGVEEGQKYNRVVTPVVEDENLDSVTLTKDGQEVENYQLGTSIKDAGQYKITATDKFENTTTVSFEVEVSDIITSKDTTKVTVNEEETIVTDISPKTKLTDLKTLLESQMDYTVVDKNGNELSETGLIGTGCKIKMANDEKIYTIIVPGDCDGNGTVNVSGDMIKLNVHRLSGNGLTNEYLTAADLDENGRITVNDMILMNVIRLKQNT